MQAAAGIRVVVGTLAVRAAGLVNTIGWPGQDGAERSVQFAGPLRAMFGFAELVGYEVEWRDFGAVPVAEQEWCARAATLQTGQARK